MSHSNPYIAVADRLLTTVVPGARGAWPRACAWLLRLALETALDEYWKRISPAIGAFPGRQQQILALDHYAGRRLAAKTGYTWWALSRGGHHHSYELGLTANELHHLRDDVVTLTARLAASAPSERRSD